MNLGLRWFCLSGFIHPPARTPTQPSGHIRRGMAGHRVGLKVSPGVSTEKAGKLTQENIRGARESLQHNRGWFWTDGAFP
jgi:hypothetical protein